MEVLGAWRVRTRRLLSPSTRLLLPALGTLGLAALIGTERAGLLCAAGVVMALLVRLTGDGRAPHTSERQTAALNS
jgi:hypothetical protein